MEQYIISKLAIAKAQLEVTLLETQWKLEQAYKEIEVLKKGSDEHGRCQDSESNG